MKTHLTTLFGGILLSLLVSAPGYPAEPPPSAPKMINLQAVLVDDGGNVLYEKQEADIVFSIIDGDGSTLYEEVQHVPIVNGAISVMVGRGNNVSDNQPTGGIPMEALIPDGTKLLRIKLNEQSIPQEDLQLGSVPYALYAESLSHPIESDEILDGTLIQADLSAELLTYLTDSISNTSSTAITAHRTESGAHPASSISVVNNFTHAAGTNLQSVLSGLDAAIGTRRNQEGEIIEDVGDEIAARVAADTAESTARELADATEAGIREAADVVFDLRLDTIESTLLDINNIPGNLLTTRLAGTISNSQIADNAVTSSKIENGTVTTADMASSNISQWTNDSLYITDGNTNWNNEYGFITDGNTNWNNEYGFITDGNEGWDNSYGFITDGNTNWGNDYGFVTDPETVSISGDELLGDLTFNNTSCMNAYGHNCQVDNVDVSELATRVPAGGAAPVHDHPYAPIDHTHTLSTTLPPPTPQIVAWVRTSNAQTIPVGTCSTDESIITGSYNINCIKRTSTDGAFDIFLETNPVPGPDDAVTNGYIVIGNTWGIEGDGDPANGLIGIVTTRAGWFSIQVWDSQFPSGSDDDFMLSIIKTSTTPQPSLSIN